MDLPNFQKVYMSQFLTHVWTGPVPRDRLQVFLAAWSAINRRVVLNFISLPGRAALALLSDDGEGFFPRRVIQAFALPAAEESGIDGIGMMHDELWLKQVRALGFEPNLWETEFSLELKRLFIENFEEAVAMGFLIENIARALFVKMREMLNVSGYTDELLGVHIIPHISFEEGHAKAVASLQEHIDPQLLKKCEDFWVRLLDFIQSLLVE